MSASGVHDLVGEADPERFVGADLTAGEAQLLRTARADESGQTLRAAATRNDAEQDLRLSEHRLVRRDAVVAGQREFASAAQRVPADRGDHEARDRGDGVEGIVERRTDRGRLVWAAELGDVGTCGEQPITTRDHDGARRILGQFRRRGPDLAEQLRRQGIDLAVGEREERDPVGLSFEREQFGHSRSLADRVPLVPPAQAGRSVGSSWSGRLSDHADRDSHAPVATNSNMIAAHTRYAVVRPKLS